MNFYTELEERRLNEAYVANPNPNNAQYTALHEKLGTKIGVIKHYFKSRKARDQELLPPKKTQKLTSPTRKQPSRKSKSPRVQPSPQPQTSSEANHSPQPPLQPPLQPQRTISSLQTKPLQPSQGSKVSRKSNKKVGSSLLRSNHRTRVPSASQPIVQSASQINHSTGCETNRQKPQVAQETTSPIVTNDSLNCNLKSINLHSNQQSHSSSPNPIPVESTNPPSTEHKRPIDTQNANFNTNSNSPFKMSRDEIRDVLIKCDLISPDDNFELQVDGENIDNYIESLSNQPRIKLPRAVIDLLVKHDLLSDQSSDEEMIYENLGWYNEAQVKVPSPIGDYSIKCDLISNVSSEQEVTEANAEATQKEEKMHLSENNMPEYLAEVNKEQSQYKMTLNEDLLEREDFRLIANLAQWLGNTEVIEKVEQEAAEIRLNYDLANSRGQATVENARDMPTNSKEEELFE